MHLLVLIIILGSLALLFFLTRNIEMEFKAQLDSTYGITLKLKVGLLFGKIPIKFSCLVCKDGANKWVANTRMGRRRLPTVGIKELIDKLIAPKKKKEKRGHIPFRIIRLNANVEVGVDDAAQCAIACGGIKMLIEMIFAYFAQENTQFLVTAVPLYNQSRIRMNLTGIVNVKSEQIIVNVIKLHVKKQKDGE